jgi:acetyl esterase
MPLDPDAARLAEQISAVLPEPIHTLGVDGARAFVASLGKNRAVGTAVKEVRDLEFDGPGGALGVRVYWPNDQQLPPILVYLHGGGWVTGSPDGVDLPCRQLCADAGVLVVSVDYRLAPEHQFPAAIEDAYAALHWAHDHAGELGGDPNQIAIGGESAGANLAAATALLARNGGPALKFQLLAYPVTEYHVQRPSLVENADAPLLTTADLEWFWNNYLPNPEAALDPRATPSSAADLSRLPPTFVLTGEYDPVRDDGENYAAQLSAAGVQVTQRRYSGVFHSFFGMLGVLAKASQAHADAASELRRYLREDHPH